MNVAEAAGYRQEDGHVKQDVRCRVESGEHMLSIFSEINDRSSLLAAYASPQSMHLAVFLAALAVF